MGNIGFSKNILRRNIVMNGKEYIFKRNVKNTFKEEVKNSYELNTILIKGLFHQTSSYITIGEGEAARVQKKVTPMIMCIYEDSTLLKFNDKVEFNNHLYKVNGITNINEENAFADISLEVIS